MRLSGQPVALGPLVPDPGVHPAAVTHRLRVLGGLRRQVSRAESESEAPGRAAGAQSVCGSWGEKG